MSPSTNGPGGARPGTRPAQGQSHLTGHRRLPAAVYRRRRIALVALTLLVVVLFIVGISLLVGGLKKGKASAQDDPAQQAAAAQETEASTPTPTAPVPVGDEASGMCDEGAVQMSAKTDKKSYKPDGMVKMVLTVKNASGESCNIAVGVKQQDFQIKQGDKTVWSSRFCQTGTVDDQTATFAAGASKDAKLEWHMESVDDKCNRVADEVPAGDYQLVVKLGDKSTAPAGFKVEASKSTEKAKES
ncbi:hypothetical protein NQ038_01435 [Brevibacterium sp. 50QC2O2]|uniref:hypothetical protein n=1 Tax=Brevibacterium sp. 50QC2O2 TaxID=2968459 RepID=UPI00211C0709|nr:hypothetical protein [Brevibacterium sp. 50QC2O2]MCQ9387316.1 hypothetical protein [Brevibacterium sp. 50QC2O2]